MNARDEVLERIRRAHGDGHRAGEIPRNYRGPVGLGSSDLFAQRLQDYRAIVKRLTSGEVAIELQESLVRRGVTRVMVPEGVAPGWLAHVSASVVSDSPDLSTAQLDQLDGVITTCSVAIAETGTIVLTHGAGQGRRALTLVPDYHLVVVYESQVLSGVPDAIGALDPTLPMTWISGPSATSDIELIRVEGVHGPRTLEVLVVSGT